MIIWSGFDLKYVVAFLAGHLDFPLPPRGAQTLLAPGAAKIFVHVPIAEAGVLEFEPILHRRPETEKGVIFPLTGSMVPRKHPEQHINEDGVCHKGNGPEKAAKDGDDQCHDQQEQAEFIPAVAAVHELLELLQQQQKHILSK